MSVLILVRHGESPSNLSHLLDTAPPGPALTELGTAQAATLSDRLNQFPIDSVYASTLVRTQLTAGPVAATLGLPVVIRDGLREVPAGDLEMRGDRESVGRYLATAFSWPGSEPELRMPGGENGTEVLTRFDEVVAEVAASGARTALLVSHGAIIRVWVAARARNVDAEFAATTWLANTGIVVLEGDPATGWTAISWTGANISDATLL